MHEQGALLWFVDVPGPNSEIEDICWRASLAELGLAIRGGLDPANLTICDNRDQACRLAYQLLAARDAKTT